MDNGRLLIFFDTQFAADSILEDIVVLEEQVAQVLGRKLKLEICVEQEEKNGKTEKPQEKEAQDERVNLALKIFRGEVVK